MSSAAIEAHDVSKIFAGGIVAVNGLDLKIEAGTVFGLMGRNGAGKTTTIRLLLGLLRPNRGDARVLGEDLWQAPRETRSRVAYVSQSQQLHAWMTPSELCHYASHFYPKWDGDYARALSRRFGLAWEQQVGLMSGGQRRKVAITLALAARPDVLFLDEPAAGLDPIARKDLVDELIDVISKGDANTVLFSTHIITDLERVAEKVGFMDRGRIVTAGAVDELQTGTKRVQIIFEGEAPPRDFKIPGAIRTDVDGPVINAIVRMESETQLDEIRQLPGARLNTYPLGLEEIFIETFGLEAHEDLGPGDDTPESILRRRGGGLWWVLLVLLGVGLLFFFFLLLKVG